VTGLTLTVTSADLRAQAEELARQLREEGLTVELTDEDPGDSLVFEAVGDALSDGREVLAVLRRGDPRDGLIVSDAHAVQLAELLARDPSAIHPADPLRAVGVEGRVAAAGDLRRALITATRPDVRVVSVPGHGEAHEAVSAGEADAAVLPAAWLEDHGLDHLIRRRLDAPWNTEAGASATWVRGPWEAALREALLPWDDRVSRLGVVAELAVQNTVEIAPGVLFGVSATVSHSRLDLRALAIEPVSGASLAAVRAGEATMRGAHRLAAILARDLQEKGLGALGRSDA